MCSTYRTGGTRTNRQTPMLVLLLITLGGDNGLGQIDADDPARAY
jgi:hypothetical protein